MIGRAFLLAGALLLAGCSGKLPATPPGQPPLRKIASGSLEPIREAFNASSDRARLLLLLSPS